MALSASPKSMVWLEEPLPSEQPTSARASRPRMFLMAVVFTIISMSASDRLAAIYGMLSEMLSLVELLNGLSLFN